MAQSRITKWLLRLLVAGALFAFVAAAGAWALFNHYDRDLPSVEDLKGYRGPQVTKVFCRDGELCAEFYRERRTWVDVAQLPAHVKNAFLAAEDADFYTHEGLDFFGIVRAGLKGLLPGGHMTGASTISQQACRNLLLSQERTFSRKVREWILTPRMEKALTKDEILALYLNTIYFGHNRYGLEEAALFYFGKSARDLDLGEGATLAGTVQSPARINPLSNIVRAKKRQQYVLNQLAKHRLASPAAIAAEVERPITLGPRPPVWPGATYAEEIRRTLVARYGETAVLEGGLRVDIPMSVKLQAAAEAAVKKGLEAVDRRQGYRGPVGTLTTERFAQLKPLLEAHVREAGKRRPDDVLVPDLSALKNAAEPLADPDNPDMLSEEVTDALSSDERLVDSVPVRALGEAQATVAFVSEVDVTKNVARLSLVTQEATLRLADAAWARRRDGNGRLGPMPTKMGDVVAVGDLVRVRLSPAPQGSSALVAALDQVPAVQGALVVINPSDRTVVAMVGGYDARTSAFNRATQARRQPGSAFKPFLYAAALSSARYTPFTQVNDAPEAIRDEFTGKLWKPQNYEKGGFDGPMTLRQALTRSKNTVSVRLIQALTPAAVIEFARLAGIHSPMPENFTLALGTGEVTLLELTNAYATFLAQGSFADAVMLNRVADARGVILEEHRAAPEPALSPAVAYLSTSLMRSVVEEGTAMAVRDLGRPAAGKTGTAQEFRDTWFAGFTADYVAGAWVGFDNHESLGHGETGGHAALPLWLDVMKRAHEGLPVRDFDVPAGVTLVRVDPTTGLLAGKSVPGRVEPFLAGTEPTEETTAAGTVDPNDFHFYDTTRGHR